MLKNFAIIICVCLAGLLSGQTFTFECACTYLTAPNCDVCGPTVSERSFHGLIIKKSGTPYKWIDDPYTVRLLKTQAIQFLEQGPGGESVTVSLSQTAFGSMTEFRDSTSCTCGSSSALTEVETGYPLIGDGTPGSPVTIGQNGADTTSYLRWDGTKWAPHSPKAIIQEYAVTYSTGATTATVAVALPTRDADIFVYRGGARYKVGPTGCTGCNVSRSSLTFTFSRAIASGETIQIMGLKFY